MRTIFCRPPKAAWMSVVTVLATALALTWAIGAVSARAAEGCANEALRKEDNSTALPDCRAYELVSPPSAQASGYDVRKPAQMVAQDGDAIAWLSEGAFAGQPSAGLAEQYVSRRSGSGWST